MATRTYQQGCLTVTLGRIGGIGASAARISDFSASATRISDFAVVVGLVCAVSIGEMGIIWASDGKLITLEGGYLIGA